MPVPVWTVGEVLAASDVNTWFVPTVAYKPADTGRTNTTRSNDPDLVVAVTANAVYAVTMNLVYKGPANGTADLKFGFNIPAGASGQYNIMQFNIAGPTFQMVTSAWGTVNTSGTNGTSTVMGAFLYGTLVTVGTPGSLAYSWAQNTNNGTTTVMATSTLSAQRIF